MSFSCAFVVHQSFHSALYKFQMLGFLFFLPFFLSDIFTFVSWGRMRLSTCFLSLLATQLSSPACNWVCLHVSEPATKHVTESSCVGRVEHAFEAGPLKFPLWDSTESLLVFSYGQLGGRLRDLTMIQSLNGKILDHWLTLWSINFSALPHYHFPILLW